MSTTNDNLNRPILESPNDADFRYRGSTYLSGGVNSFRQYTTRDRNGDLFKTLEMISILMRQHEAEYQRHDNDPLLILFPNMLSTPAIGDKLKNRITGEVYTINAIISNPIKKKWEGLVKIASTSTPPEPGLGEKLQVINLNRLIYFTSEYPLSRDGIGQDASGHISDSGPMRPTIVYSIVKKAPAGSEAPFQGTKHHGRRLRETLHNPDSINHSVDMIAQVFDVIVEFTCFSTDNYSTDLLACWFEYFMTTHTSVLRLNGVRDVLYWQGLRDAAVTKWRQDLISRTVQYFFRVETVTPVVVRNISNIDIVSNLSEDIITTGEYEITFRDSDGNYLFGNTVLNDQNL